MFCCKKHIKHHIIRYRGLTPHISTLRLIGEFLNYNSLKAHSLTDVSEMGEKEGLYDTMETAYDESSSYNKKLILGDLKAKIGREMLLPS
jgi:hypothetical protein